MPLQKTQFEDYRLMGLQQDLASKLDPLEQVPFLKGAKLADLELVSGANSLNHKLGRAPLGFFVMKKNANANLWNGSMDERTIEINASAAVGCDLWVF